MIGTGICITAANRDTPAPTTLATTIAPSPTAAPARVGYRVTSGADRIEIRYTHPDGTRHQTHSAPPWHTTFGSFTPGDSLLVTAETQSEGDLWCEILINGAVAARYTGSGAGTTCRATATLRTR